MKFVISSTLVLSLIPNIYGLATRDSNSGCNNALPPDVFPDKSVNLTLASSGSDTPRKYRLHLPAGYDGTQQLPLILSFHGRTQDALYQENLSQFSNATYGFSGIAVYPEGVPLIKNGKPIQQWQGDPDSPPSVNDVQFTLDLIDYLQTTFCIDPSRIYATGKSNGGGFTGLLACDPVASTRIAAFAAVSGAFYLDATTQKLPECKPGRVPVSIMELHGLQDKTANYTGSLNTRKNANSTDIVTYVDDWAKRDGFSVNANTTSTLCSGDRKVSKFVWGDETVVHYAYKNLGHDWMSSFPNGDTGDNESLLTCKKAEATSLILKWFSKWSL